MKKLWHDPVISSVIAGAIPWFAGITYAVVVGGSSDPKEIEKSIIDFLRGSGYPNWLLVLLTGLLLGVCVYAYQKWRQQRDRKSLSSEDWFNLVNEKLKECRYARIYLRNFEHPDSFREEHRPALMKIMQTLKERMALNADIKIVSYADASGKSGVDWLNSELRGSVRAEDFVWMVTQQISANASSIYLFDDRVAVFNKVVDGTIYYFCETHVRSISFDFTRRGLESYWGQP